MPVFSLFFMLVYYKINISQNGEKYCIGQLVLISKGTGKVIYSNIDIVYYRYYFCILYYNFEIELIQLKIILLKIYKTNTF